jgi:hypothetical protein
VTDLLQELDGAGGRRDANLGLLAGAQAKLQVRPGVSGVDPQILALIHSTPVRVLPKPQPARMPVRPIAGRGELVGAPQKLPGEGAPLYAAVPPRPGKSLRLRGCVVADAVVVEPVSEGRFPANREKNRDRPAKRRPKAIWAR